MPMPMRQFAFLLALLCGIGLAHAAENANEPMARMRVSFDRDGITATRTEGYADPATPPIEDLKKVHRVITGYFSVVKDASRFPIGGNADLAAALRGENPNRETYVPGGHKVFSTDGLLLDRWGSHLVVHPEAWTQIELRSAGPDKIPYTADDLVLKPSGQSSN